MRVKFYVFSKKYNSTLRPTSDLTPQEYDCVLKSSSSVISPTLELNYGLVLNPSQYNYCYIEDYGRYYWITEWTFMKSYWLASLSVDVLATWRPYIGNTDMYVYRSSYEYNPKVPDGAYSTTGDSDVQKISLQNQLLSDIDLNNGYYIVQIYGIFDYDDDTSRYYVFTPSQFTTFINKMYATLADDGLFETLAVGIRNSIFNISDYIGSCRWSPIEPYCQQQTTTSLRIGSTTLTGIACRKLFTYSDGSSIRWAVKFDVQIPKHPASLTRGECYNLKPYSEYKLYYLPFGIKELDPNKLMCRKYLSLHIVVDAITGEGILTVKAYNYDLTDPSNPLLIDEIILHTATCKYLVEIPLLYSKTDTFAITQNATYEAINRTYASKVATASLTAIHGINTFVDLAVPDGEIQGNRTGLVELGYENNILQCIFYGIADDDNDSRGRPLLKVRKPMNIPGYIEGESHNFKAPATESEQIEVRNFIESGFYYE